MPVSNRRWAVLTHTPRPRPTVRGCSRPTAGRQSFPAGLAAGSTPDTASAAPARRSPPPRTTSGRRGRFPPSPAGGLPGRRRWPRSARPGTATRPDRPARPKADEFADASCTASSGEGAPLAGEQRQSGGMAIDQFGNQPAGHHSPRRYRAGIFPRRRRNSRKAQGRSTHHLTKYNRQRPRSKGERLQHMLNKGPQGGRRRKITLGPFPIPPSNRSDIL